MVVEPSATTLRALIERERGRALIAYDPNVRLDIEPDVARWQAQLEWMLPRCDLLKVSDEDLALLFPGCGVAEFAARMLACGTTALVVQCWRAWPKTGALRSASRLPVR